MKNYSTIETTILNLLATSLNEFTTEPFSEIRFENRGRIIQIKAEKGLEKVKNSRKSLW